MPEHTPKITVSVLCGKPAIAGYAAWRRGDGESISDEVGSGFKTYEFDTEEEAAAFRKGLEVGAGLTDVMHLSPEQTAAIRMNLAKASRGNPRP